MDLLPETGIFFWSLQSLHFTGFCCNLESAVVLIFSRGAGVELYHDVNLLK